MTTVYAQRATCSVCGFESEFPAISSTNAFGSPDLDGRPPEMHRSTMYAWVQQCPKCGYCASDVSIKSRSAPALVASEPYRARLTDGAMPPLANRFLCQAMILKAEGDLAGAIWARISAAWSCDDGGKAEQGKECRHSAADLMLQAEREGLSVTEEEGAAAAILVDLLRRAGRFDEAAAVIDERLPRMNAGVASSVLEYERELIRKRDMDCHTIGEAMREDDGCG